MTRPLLVLVCCFPALLSANCSGDSKRPNAASTVAAAAGVGDQGELCSRFTPAEIAEQFGTPVGSGERAGVQGPGLGSGCQWAAVNNDTAFAMMSVIPDTSGWSNPIAAPSYQKVTGIDGQGFSVKDPQGGWRAEARNGKGAYGVMLIGAPSASREGAVALLRKLLERL